MFTILALLVVSLAQTQAPAPAGAIHGRVIDNDTGRPLARAVVRLSPLDSTRGDVLSATTDDRGAFTFDALPAGRYGGIVSARQHVMQPLTMGAELTVTPDRAVDVTVAVPRTYAIDVRVVDAFGDPNWARASTHRPPREAVTHLHHGRSRSGAPVRRGSGPYTLCAEPNTLGVPSGPPAERGDRLVRTCYPSADEADAEPIRVAQSDVEGIEIRMRRGRTFTIAGTVLDASGAPARDAHAGLNRYREYGGGSTGIDVDATGHFRIANVAPGTYGISASLGGIDQGFQSRPDEAALVIIQLTDEDVEDVVVPLRKTTDVQGRVTLEDPAAPFLEPPGSGLWIDAMLAGLAVPSGDTAVARKDRTFTLTATFGARTIEVQNVPQGWYAKAARYGDRNALDEPVEFRTGADAPALEILLSNRGATVTGTVESETGAPGARALALVYLLRADPGRKGFRVAAQGRTSAAGAFTLGPVRGGEYIAVVLPASAPALDSRQHERLARLAALGERVTLADLDERSVLLRTVAER
jgi:hypothetical protein